MVHRNAAPSDCLLERMAAAENTRCRMGPEVGAERTRKDDASPNRTLAAALWVFRRLIGEDGDDSH